MQNQTTSLASPPLRLGVTTAYVHGRAQLASGEQTVVARVAGRSTIRRGDTVRVVPETARLHLFDPDSGHRLGEGEPQAG